MRLAAGVDEDPAGVAERREDVRREQGKVHVIPGRGGGYDGDPGGLQGVPRPPAAKEGVHEVQIDEGHRLAPRGQRKCPVEGHFGLPAAEGADENLDGGHRCTRVHGTKGVLQAPSGAGRIPPRAPTSLA